MKTKMIFGLIATITFTGCSGSLEESNLVDEKNDSVEINAVATSSENIVNDLGALYVLEHNSTNGNLVYDSNTEIVYIKFDCSGMNGRSYGYFSVYYHTDGLPLHYCPHKDMFYTLDNDKVVEIEFKGSCPADLWVEDE